MTKHSKFEREKRAAQNLRIQEIGEAMQRAVPADVAAEFARKVEAARARGPEPKRPDMAPGTIPNPPRPGHEPKVAKEERRRPRF
jgi:hypothetical protein